ncbi:MAG: NAD(P)/FAD-dependent oxidoreductase [Chloroflexota bacterium]
MASAGGGSVSSEVPVLYDVAVIGGGPVGSSVAGQLAAAGYRVVVLEKHAGSGEKVSCTGIIGWPYLCSLGIGDDVLRRRLNGARLFSPSGKELRLWRPEPQAGVVDRAAFDREMVRRAGEKGAEYRWGVRATGVVVGDDRVEVTGGDGGEKVAARVVVVANGFSPALTSRLGLGRVGDFVAGAQVEVGGVTVDETEVYLGREVAPGFFGWLVPTLPGRALVGLLSRRHPGRYLLGLVSSLASRGKIAFAGEPLKYGGIPLKPLAQTYRERLLVVGDAAGQVKPTTGGGIYYGLLCADIAVGTLQEALAADDLSARRLSRYQRAWRRRLGRELRTGYWARRLYERLSDRQIDQLFDIISSQGVDRAILEAADLSFDWHGEVIWRLVKYGAIARVAGVVKAPFARRGMG